MSKRVKLSDLRSRVREISDTENKTARVANALLDVLINQGGRELHDFLVAAYGADYFRQRREFDTVSGQEGYPLPDNFLQNLSVAVKISADQWYTLARMEPDEYYDVVHNRAWSRWSDVRYIIWGSESQDKGLWFSPIPNAVYTIRQQYIPAYTELSNVDDELDGINGWEKYVEIYAARELAIRDGNADGTVNLLGARLEEMKDRLRRIASQRDRGMPERGIDLKSTQFSSRRHRRLARWMW